MTPQLSDRLKEVQRQYAEMEHNTATLQNAQRTAEKAAWAAANNLDSLTTKCREEYRVRQQLIEGIKAWRREVWQIALIAGFFAGLFGWFTAAAGKGMWDILLEAIRTGWNA